MAVAVFQTSDVVGEVLFESKPHGVFINAIFSKLPPGMHGFHIHKAGDVRGSGCKNACDHWSLTASHHGGTPEQGGERHTGDLGNIEGPSCKHTYFLRGVSLNDLYGRSLIVHADQDDLGLGSAPDSKTTGNSGARIACAIIGRMICNDNSQRRTRRRRRRAIRD